MDIYMKLSEEDMELLQSALISYGATSNMMGFRAEEPNIRDYWAAKVERLDNLFYRLSEAQNAC